MLIFQRQAIARGKTSKGLIEIYPPVSPLPLFPQANGPGNLTMVLLLVFAQEGSFPRRCCQCQLLTQCGALAWEMSSFRKGSGLGYVLAHLSS